MGVVKPQERLRLIGTDGKLVRVEFEDQLEGDGIQDIADLVGDADAAVGWYRVDGKAESDSAFGALSVKDLFFSDGSMVPADGDAFTPLLETDLTDIESWDLDVTVQEVDVTVLVDTTNKYRAGRSDMSGSIEGVFIVGVTDIAGGITNRFFRIIRQTAEGTFTVNEIDGAPIYLKGVAHRSGLPEAFEAFYWMRVVLLGYRAGASGQDKQAFTSNVRIAAGEEEPTLYEREIYENAQAGGDS